VLRGAIDNLSLELAFAYFFQFAFCREFRGFSLIFLKNPRQLAKFAAKVFGTLNSSDN